MSPFKSIRSDDGKYVKQTSVSNFKNEKGEMLFRPSSLEEYMKFMVEKNKKGGTKKVSWMKRKHQTSKYMKKHRLNNKRSHTKKNKHHTKKNKRLNNNNNNKRSHNKK